MITLKHRVYLISRPITVKTKPRFGECYTCFGCETKPGMVGISVISLYINDIVSLGGFGVYASKNTEGYILAMTTRTTLHART